MNGAVLPQVVCRSAHGGHSGAAIESVPVRDVQLDLHGRVQHGEAHPDHLRAREDPLLPGHDRGSGVCILGERELGGEVTPRGVLRESCPDHGLNG